MKRIIVIGCPGSGKTTFATKFSEALGLPIIHLDAIWHKADKTHISREEFDERLSNILAGKEWIIDGNYSRTIERRIAACDTVFLFDIPVEDCIQGAISRLGKKRADMPWIDTELDPFLEREIIEFGSKNLPAIYALLKQSGGEREVIVFKSRAEADELLSKM